MNIRRLVSCVLILCVTLCGCMSKKVDSTEKKNGGYTQTTEKQESKKETTQSNEKTKETDIGKKLQECIAEKEYLSNYVVTRPGCIKQISIRERSFHPKWTFVIPNILEINFRKY